MKGFEVFTDRDYEEASMDFGSIIMVASTVLLMVMGVLLG